MVFRDRPANGPENVGNQDSGFADGVSILIDEPNCNGIGATNFSPRPNTLRALLIAPYTGANPG